MSDKNPYPDIFEEIAEIRRSGRQSALVTVVSAKGSTPRKTGAHMIVHDDGSILGTVGGGLRESDIITAAKEAISNGEPRLMEVDFTEGLRSGSGPVCGGVMQVFIEPLVRNRQIVICGAGHIGWYLHRLFRMLDYRVCIIDPRPELNTQERFPGARICLRQFEDGLGDIELTEADALVLVGPGHDADARMLPHALHSPVGYLGMIGSRRKIAEVRQNMEKQGFTDDDFKRIHAPVGLDIGSETPAEIAVSIAAEVIAFVRGASDATP